MFEKSWFHQSIEHEAECDWVDYPGRLDSALVILATVGTFQTPSKLPSGRDPALGYAVRTGGKLCYVMLDVFDSSSAQFEQGRTAGREEERNRVMKEFHAEVSSSLIAALFLIQTAKIELEDASLPQAQAVSKASDILTDATEKIVDVLTATREQST